MKTVEKVRKDTKKTLPGKISWSKASLKKSERLKIKKSLKQQALQYSSYKLSSGEWLKYGGIGFVICGLISYVFYKNMVAFFLFSPVTIIYPLYQREQLKIRRLDKLRFQFKEAITILASSLSAGYSVENAFSVTVRELSQLYGEEELITKEFAGIVHQLKMNRQVEELIMEFANRSGLEDVKSFAEIFGVAKRSGGELVQIINHVTKVIGDKIQVKEEIITLTLEKRFEQNIMNLVPFLIVFYINMTSPGFFNVMYETALGRTIMTICLVVYGAAYILSQKLLEIEV